MSAVKIVITGGPGTGKTSIIKKLSELGHVCLPEISRQVTLEARKNGIEQLFLENPVLFSEKLLEGRKNQFLEALNYERKAVFLDRGLPDILAYMNYIGDPLPPHFEEACKLHKYDKVFLLPPWEAIYQPDTERYESFEQAVTIHGYLKKTYESFGYTLIEVPFGEVHKRAAFVLSNI